MIKAKSELIKAFSLLQKLHDSQTISPFVERILANASDSTLDKIPSAYIRDRVLTICDRFWLDVEHCARGQIRFTNSEWFSIDKELLCAAQKEILATSHADVNEVWNTRVGQTYWEENQRRVREGVRCCRVFILSKAEITDLPLLKSLYAIMREQKDSGIEVRVVEEDALEPELRKDVAIFDGSIYSLTILTRSGGIGGTEVYWDLPIVKKAMAEFSLTREKSDQLDKFMKKYPVQ